MWPGGPDPLFRTRASKRRQRQRKERWTRREPRTKTAYLAQHVVSLSLPLAAFARPVLKKSGYTATQPGSFRLYFAKRMPTALFVYAPVDPPLQNITSGCRHPGFVNILNNGKLLGGTIRQDKPQPDGQPIKQFIPEESPRTARTGSFCRKMDKKIQAAVKI